MIPQSGRTFSSRGSASCPGRATGATREILGESCSVSDESWSPRPALDSWLTRSCAPHLCSEWQHCFPWYLSHWGHEPFNWWACRHAAWDVKRLSLLRGGSVKQRPCKLMAVSLSQLVNLVWAQNRTSQKNRQFSLCRTLLDSSQVLNPALDLTLQGSRRPGPPCLPSKQCFPRYLGAQAHLKG